MRDEGLSAERPFTGLRAFGYPDHAFFFGRRDQTYSLYRLTAFGLIAVIGSSGSGKSSLVRAGLYPLLLESDEAQRWAVATMTPGDHPIANLARAVAELGAPGATAPDRAIRRDRIEHLLRTSSSGLADALDETPELAGRSILIVVDQFEEIFRYAAVDSESNPLKSSLWRDEAAWFVQLLLQLYRRRNTAHALITMRSDFIGDCAQFAGLSEAVSATQFLVPAMARSDREQAIRKPIEKAGASIDPLLVEQLLNDIGHESDQLPVLQHCLLRMWDHAKERRLRGDSRITDADYVAVGKMTGALSQHADAIMRDLPGLEPVVEQVFRALSERDKEGRAIRRPIAFRQLVNETGRSEADVRRVVDRFRADDCSFLLPSLAVVPVLADDTRIDVVHEALLRRWNRITPVKAGEIGWLAREDDDGKYYRSVLARIETGEATLPLESVNERYAWWTSPPHSEAWTRRYGGKRDRVEAFFAASVAALKADTKDREEQRSQRERTTRALATRTRALAAITLLAIIAGTLAALYVGRAQAAQSRVLEAQRQQLSEESRKLEDASALNLSMRRANRHAMMVLASDRSTEAKRVAADAARLQRQQAQLDAQSRTLRLEETELAQRERELGERDRAIATKDKQLVATTGRATTAENAAKQDLVVRTRQQAQSFQQYAPLVESHQDYEDAVTLLTAAYTNNQRDHALAFELGRAIGMAQIGNGPWHTGSQEISAMAMHPTDHAVATGNVDGTIELWDDTNAPPIRISTFPDPVTALAFDPTGTALAIGRSDGFVEVFELGPKHKVVGHLELRTSAGKVGHTGRVNGLAFNHDGSLLATGGDDGNLILWCARSSASCRAGQSAAPPKALGTKSSPLPVTAVSFTYDDQPVAVANDGSIWASDQSLRSVRALRPADGHILNRIEAGANGRYLFASAEDGTAWLYDATARHAVPFSWKGELDVARFSSSGADLVAGAPDGTVAGFDPASGAQRWICPGPGQQSANVNSPSVLAIAFSASPALMFVSYGDGTILGRKMGPSCEVVERRHITQGISRYIAVNADATFLSVGGSDGRLRRWNFDPRAAYVRVAGAGGTLVGLALDRSGSRMASLTTNGLWQVWRLDGTRAPVSTGSFSTKGGASLVVRLDDSGSRLALADSDHAQVYDTATGTLQMTIRATPGSDKGISDVAFDGASVIVSQRSVVPSTADRWRRYDARGVQKALESQSQSDLAWLYPVPHSADLVALSPFDSHVAVYSDVTSGTAIKTWTQVAAVAVSESPLVALGAMNGYVTITDRVGARIAGVNAGSVAIKSLVLSNDGDWLVTLDVAGHAALWDVANRVNGDALAANAIAADAPISAITFDPARGRLLVAVTATDHVELFDRASPGLPLDDQTPCASHVQSAQFSPDGSTIVVGCTDGTIASMELDHSLPRQPPNLIASQALCHEPIDSDGIILAARSTLARLYKISLDSDIVAKAYKCTGG
jgi:WD40 repeat protein